MILDPMSDIFRFDQRKNEKRKIAKFAVPSDGEWHTFSEAMEIDFDLAVTELAALQFKVSAPTDELCFKNLVMAKASE